MTYTVRNLSLRVLSCLLSVCVVLIIVESLFFLTGYSKKEIYWSWVTPEYSDSKFELNSDRIYGLRPSVQLVSEEGIVETTDENGMRKHGCQYASSKKIVFIGDSFTWGHGVSDDETYPYFFAEFLDRNTYCVLNAGVQGYSLHQEYIYLNELLNEYNPEIIVWNLELGDLSNSLTDDLLSLKNNRLYQKSALFTPLYIQGTMTRIAVRIFPQSNIMNMLAYILQKDSWSLEFSNREKQIFSAVLDTVRTISARRPVKIFFVLVPRKGLLLQENTDDMQTYSFMDSTLQMHTDRYVETNRVLHSLYESSGSSDMKEGSLKDLFLSNDPNGHLNKEGNKVLAKIVYDFVTSSYTD